MNKQITQLLRTGFGNIKRNEWFAAHVLFERALTETRSRQDLDGDFRKVVICTAIAYAKAGNPKDACEILRGFRGNRRTDAIRQLILSNQTGFATFDPLERHGTEMTVTHAQVRAHALIRAGKYHCTDEFRRQFSVILRKHGIAHKQIADAISMSASTLSSKLSAHFTTTLSELNAMRDTMLKLGVPKEDVDSVFDTLLKN